MKFTYCPKCATALTARGEGGLSRPACPACDFVQYDNPTPVVAAIVQREEEVVLVRNVGWPETWYGIVSGFLERGESPEEAVLREVEEELGVKAQLISFVGAHAFAQMNQLLLTYHVRIEGDYTANPDEIADTKVVPIAKLRPWPMGTGLALKQWLIEQGRADLL